MIPVTRTSTPDILKKNADKWLKKLQEAIKERQEAIIALEKIEESPKPINKEIEAAKKKVDNAQNKYNPSIRNGINPVKQPLYDMFCGKCAFCERNVELSSGRIEHFRPKSQYVDLTFDWNNFLYSCEVCNNRKGDKFPLDCDGTPLLIDPTDEDCDIYEYLEFYWDEETQLASVVGKDGRGKVVTEILDLNRKDLRKHRDKQLTILSNFLKFAKDGNQKAIEYLRQCCKFDEEYTAFALFYILPYLAHELHISEAIEMIREVGKRSPSYAKFARIDDL
ncbi:MAG: TIGR02646 family protein [Aphanizomenon flos-aquae CP01]|nr:TIGR02646 family protein [Aphanizomenon flos-aquae CP01]